MLGPLVSCIHVPIQFNKQEGDQNSCCIDGTPGLGICSGQSQGTIEPRAGRGFAHFHSAAVTARLTGLREKASVHF